ncbi:MAG: cupin domain-containing protein, partial [Pseudomonadota bacterium]
VELLHFAGGPAVATADCGLVRIEAGTQFPYHTHIGTETALILAGCLEDHDGQVYYPGDVSFMEPGSGHTFKAIGDDDLLLAVVINEGLSFAPPEKAR